VTQADLQGLATQDQLAAAMAQWQAANNAANAAQRQRRPSAPRLRQRANALALQVSALKARMEKLEQANSGGPASDWAREDVQQALDNGLLVGRREGATVDDDEWQTATSRQELATALGRLESRSNAAAQTAVKEHNDSAEAHPFIQGLIGEECRQRKQADTWLWIAVVIAAIIGLIGWFLPRIRAAVAPEEEPEEEPEEPDAPAPDGPDGPVPAPAPGAGDPPPAPAPEPEPTPDEGGDDDQ